MNIKTNEQITVVNREILVLKEDWVQKNFKPAVVEYVKCITRLQIDNDPYADIMLDRRQISYYKWSRNKDYPDGRWIVKFAKSHENEEIDEATLKEAVGEAALHLANHLRRMVKVDLFLFRLEM